MSRASLEYKNSNEKVILKTGSLYYIDSITRIFEDEEQFLNSEIVRNKVGPVIDGHIELFNVRNISSREKLPIIYNQKNELILEDDIYGREISVIENTRKLLFNSKNKLFIKNFLNIPIFKATTNYKIKITYNEYIFLKKSNVEAKMIDSEYYINASDLFEFMSNTKKYGMLRSLFEESLSIWKKRLTSQSMDSIYYYSRNFNILISEYNAKLIKKEGIKNLEFIINNLIKICNFDKENTNAKIKIKRYKSF
ncbi:MAG: hypothetical protein PUD59_02160 [bacterium]|nr:hypothetical protein [bacterium]